jgi:hypothetical protein
MISQGTIRLRIFTLFFSAMAFTAIAPSVAAHAQNAGGSSLAVSASSNSVAVLPDDPSVAISYTAYDAAAPLTRQQVREERTASLHMKYIPAGWKVLPLAPRDKVLLGFKDLYNPYTIGTIVISAGYSHLTNGQPNYGTNGGAFAQRVGAAFIRDSTEGLFTDAVFAPLLHEDPRYYVEGSDYSLIHRSLYAITRPILTRSDSGRPRLNAALLLGYAGSSALTYAYYPSSNRNVKDTVATFGGGIGGAALGFFVTEFTSGIMQRMHPDAK